MHNSSEVSEFTIDVAPLEKGLYLINFSGKEVMVTQKFIKE
jgi:hypothetical protein